MAILKKFSKAKIPPSILGIGLAIWRFIAWLSEVDFVFSLHEGTLSNTLQFFMEQGFWIAILGAFAWFLLAGNVMKPRNRTINIEILLAACFVSLLFGFMAGVKNTPSNRMVFSEWGSSPAGCTGKALTSHLKNFSDKYEMAMICVLSDATVDRYKNTTIAKTGTFAIEDAEMYAPYSGIAALRITQRTGISVVHALALLPKGSSTDKITCLDDVLKAKGKLFLNPES